MRLKDIRLQYALNKDEINAKTNSKQRYKAVFGSLFLSLIIMIGPLFFVSNFFIYLDYLEIVILGIAVLIILFTYLYDSFYILILKNTTEELLNVDYRVTKYYNLVVSSIVFLIIAVVAIILVRFVLCL